MPECRDPRDVSKGEWDEWVLKASYSNTGDKVHIVGLISGQKQRKLVRKAQSQPMKWVAQRRFETLSLDSCRGPMYPCIGVFVIDGRATGAYVRLSSGQVTDSTAKEAPLFISRSD
jgi:glutathionylspermidine synthase